MTHKELLADTLKEHGLSMTDPAKELIMLEIMHKVAHLTFTQARHKTISPYSGYREVYKHSSFEKYKKTI